MFEYARIWRAGEVSEWLKEHAWKACSVARRSQVRILFSPPSRNAISAFFCARSISNRASRKENANLTPLDCSVNNRARVGETTNLRDFLFDWSWWIRGELLDFLSILCYN